MDELQEKLSKLTTRLQRLVKCPVCFCTMDSSLKQCINGHGVCSVCASKTDKCPLCQEKLIIRKNTLLGQILESLPTPCPYLERGCNTIAFDQEHQMFCEFRPAQCFRQTCDWKGCIKDLIQHVKECYDDQDLWQLTSLKAKQSKLLTLCRVEDQVFEVFPIIFQNELFFHVVFGGTSVKPEFSNNVVISCSYFHLPTSKPTHDFYLTANFKKGKAELKLACQAKTVTDVKSIQIEGSHFLENYAHFLIVQKQYLDKFLKPGAQNHFEYTLELDSEEIA